MPDIYEVGALVSWKNARGEVGQYRVAGGGDDGGWDFIIEGQGGEGLLRVWGSELTPLVTTYPRPEQERLKAALAALRALAVPTRFERPDPV